MNQSGICDNKVFSTIHATKQTLRRSRLAQLCKDTPGIFCTWVIIRRLPMVLFGRFVCKYLFRDLLKKTAVPSLGLEIDVGEVFVF